ncbi:response regulator [Desulfovibrio sulfodismutans]|uniref:Sensory/regulatory protein RpfC n=1 Tax=Desulfolutivibrio sulfodismutans TaxID=63561 RepID=A0A7K3NHP0_9BACT|nr:ATP-binding protein [Desulfolutivibrio sulfodismutans]NDY55323.1 response regulator [Desulfolutivibrio sulfodismutans]QLA11025.1 response regulator [Desulfolutivibrio sulfodismutans DSM 3696]
MARDSRFPLSLPELERLCGSALCAVAPEGTILEAGPRARTLLGGGAGKPFPGPLRDGSILDLPGTGPLRLFPLPTKGREVILAMIPPSQAEAAEAEMGRARAATKAAEAAKSVFLTNMSHELRTPMIGILGMTELTLATSLSRKQREYLEMVRHSAASLLEIINDILDSARITAGKLELAATAFALRETVDSAITVFAPLAEQKGLALSAHIEDGVPKIVVGDPIRLRQVLINLVGNAVKFTDKGHVEVEVSLDSDLSLHPDAPRLAFTVRDTGIGIPAGKLDAIFESFTQADPSPTRKYRGAGLGLSIFKELVTMMGGEIDVSSEEGKGSVFSFRVNLRPAGERTPPEAAGGDHGAAWENALPPLTILLAEDNPVNQMFIRELLEQSGHSVIAAHTGLRAVKVLEKSRVDAVLMDIQMPEMDGMEATRIIRSATDGRIDPEVPIIALTAHAHKGDRETFLQAGMDDYLPKPVGLPEISASLLRVLARKGRLPAAPPCDDPEILDFGWLLEKARGNAAFVLKLFTAFVEEKPGMIEAMRQAATAPDLEKLAFLAHSLKGASATMGAKHLSAMAKALDTAARAGNREGSAAALVDVEKALEQVLEHMKAKMAQHAEPAPAA